MKAMILAAGRGERLRPLTDQIPKALVKVGGIPIAAHQLQKLAAIGIEEVVINISYLSHALIQAFGDYAFGVRIKYSEEETPLETGGGILKALPLLGNDPFILISCDVFTDYSFQQLPKQLDNCKAYLVLVDNPNHHLKGDFGLIQQKVCLQTLPKLTYGNIGIYHPDLFKHLTTERFPLKDALFPAIEKGLVKGEHYQGTWINVDTPDRLALADARYQELLLKSLT